MIYSLLRENRRYEGLDRFGVVDGDEEEAGGGGGGAGGSAVSSGEQGGDGAGVEPVGATLDEGADQVADHVVEKAVGGDTIDDEAIGGVPLGLGDGAEVGVGFGGCRKQMRGSLHCAAHDGAVNSFGRDDGFRGRFGGTAVGEVGVDGGEGGEVVGAKDVTGGVVEGVEIEGPGTGPDVGGESGRTDVFFPYPKIEIWGTRIGGCFQGKDAVLVGFADSGVAGVERGWDDFGGEDADAGREAAVKGPMQAGRGDGGGESEAGDLGKGVDSGIGAAGALGKDALADGALDGVAEQTLDGGQVGLDLPSAEGSSIVGEGELPLRHGAKFYPSQQAGRGPRLHGITKRQGRGPGSRFEGLVYWAFGAQQLAMGTRQRSGA